MLSLRDYRIMFAAASGTILLLALGPFGDLPARLGVWDKAVHVVACYCLTALGYLALPRMRRTDLALMLVLLSAGVEIVQSLVGRDGDFSDLLANGLGVLAIHAPSHIEAIRQRLRSETVGIGRDAPAVAPYGADRRLGRSALPPRTPPSDRPKKGGARSGG